MLHKPDTRFHPHCVCGQDFQIPSSPPPPKKKISSVSGEIPFDSQLLLQCSGLGAVPAPDLEKPVIAAVAPGLGFLAWVVLA